MVKFQQMPVTHIRICTFLQLQKLGYIMFTLDLRGQMRKSHALALETEGEIAPREAGKVWPLHQPRRLGHAA